MGGVILYGVLTGIELQAPLCGVWKIEKKPKTIKKTLLYSICLDQS